MESTPTRAKVLIVGGGIIGTSVAYHLSKTWDNIVLLEQSKIGGGTTWHAAGLVGQLRTSNSMTKINKYTVDDAFYVRYLDHTVTVTDHSFLVVTLIKDSHGYDYGQVIM